MSNGTPAQHAAKKSEAFAMGILQPLMANLAAPIRAFYLGVGHATVASWALLVFGALGIGYMWTEMVRELNAPITEARVADMEASLRERELRIAAKEIELGQGAGQLTWRLGEMEWDTDLGVVRVLFAPLPGATRLLLGWRRRGGGGGGIEVQPIVPDPGTGIATVEFQWGTTWASGDEMILSLEQELPTGRRVRFTGSGRVERIP